MDHSDGGGPRFTEPNKRIDRAHIACPDRKALGYLSRLSGTDLDSALGRLGVDPSTGFAGGVGGDPATMRTVLTDGNVRERAIALGSFQNVLIAEALPPPLHDASGNVIRRSTRAPRRGRTSTSDPRGRSHRICQCARLSPGRGRFALYAALVSGEPRWVAEHAEELARANPAAGKALIDALRCLLPSNLPAKPIVERVRAVLASRDPN